MFQRLGRYGLLMLLICCMATGVQAQWLQGYIKDSVTHFAVSGATITNTARNERATSDENGFFRIATLPSDLLYIFAPSYKADTLRYSTLFADTVDFFLSPTGDLLPNVTVQSKYNRYQLDSIDRKIEFEEAIGTRVPVVSAPQSGAFGVGINLDRVFKKKDRDKKEHEKAFTAYEKEAYVSYRFSPHLVAMYTRLKGDDLRTFLARYTPTYEWLRAHTSNDEIIFYINDKLKLFKAAKAGSKATKAF
jgi:hypothetical protein